MPMELKYEPVDLFGDDPLSKLFVTPINEEYLNESDSAQKVCGDVYLLLRLLISEDSNGRIASIRLSKYFVDYVMKKCGISYTSLINIALKNTEEKWPVYYVDVDKMLRTGSLEWNDMFTPLSDGLPEEKPLYLTINYGSRITFGAGAVFYPWVLRGISEYYGRDLFITFTSIHEANVHPYDPEHVSPEALLESLIGTHKECVDETDFLSDKLYFYSRDMGYIREYFIEEVIPQ